ncbi:Histone-lysine N-methyltransferase SETDB2 [Ophiophagus hannah]|uniref:Histone-lysine N-methyltransferase SETDB2 n=1 Tax=Ophiophagus hannah TaxID=8665 RepID=V8NWI6_OPHHA|nr:Histone-lysine N-methyltransferase SETDB2 [Ophiophagus hannah]
MEKNKVDNIFECMHKALLSLQQKINDGTATSEECNQTLALVNQLGMADLLPLAHEDKHICNLDLHLSAPGKITEDDGNDCSLLENNEGMDLRIEEESAETSSKFYQDHVCSKKCLSKRPWDSYKGENPLKLPLLCHFQRCHAKADSGSKAHDVMYKAPCGKSLRNFKDVQNYLFQTECSFLFLDHFSFNTYVQVFRSSSSPQAFVIDPDISQGAETVPVSFCNDINHDRLPCFKYWKTSWPHGYFLNNFSSSFLDSCSCTDGCIDRTKCRCLLLTKRAFLKTAMSPKNGPSHGYTHKRLEEPISSGVYECSLLCSCDKNMCQNRLVQHGLQVRLQVFSTEKKGWGVRCLDDIDKGTFVCTYAGKLMSKDEHYQDKDSGEIEEEVTKKTNQSLFSRKRKLDAVCSDSENELTQNTGRQQSLHLNAEGQPNRVQNYTSYKTLNVQAIARPKTKTSILQRRRRELGITAASSDEDEISLCQVSGTTRITPATKKGDEQSSLQGECEKLVNTRNSEANTDCHKKNLLSGTVLKSKLPMQDDKEMKKQHKDILDCSPNLFVQSVFVETHNRNFPWVAFFTKRHVKAGTELTWDYGYKAGSMPETETTCQCGSLKCRKKIL